MNRFILSTAILLLLLTLAACSGNIDSPVVPSGTTDFNTGNAVTDVQTHLWGFWNISIDIETLEVEAVLNRQGMFTANVVNFLNTNPLTLTFNINETPMGPGYIDVDIDVGITHPFPGLPRYNGYDVRGVFMGNGNGTLLTSGVTYPVLGADQFMYDDPDDYDGGGPDGYTRWYNASEFNGPGMPLFMYTPGNVATPGYTGNATLCPYKYFADSLGTQENLWTFLNDHPDLEGIFSSGATNDRNYYLRFPIPDPGVSYSYAVIANWEGVEPENHPANAPEAVACSVTDNSEVYYVGPGDFGGDIILDISLWDWETQPSTIHIESSVLSAPYTLSGSEMIPTGGNDIYSTWSVEIPADIVLSPDDNEYWIIAEYNDTYSNPYGIPNDAEDEPLMAYFRYDLYVYTSGYNLDPVCDLSVVTDMPAQGWGVVSVEFDASGSYDPEGTNLTFEWDFDNDGTFGDSYNSGTDSNPIKAFSSSNQDQVCVRLTDEDDNSSECCVDVDIQVLSTKNISLRDDEMAVDLAVDPVDGNVLILYDDGEVWEYTESGLFTQDNASYLFTGQVVPYTGNAQITNYRIDINPNSYIITSAASGACDATHGWPAQNFDSEGNQLGTAPAGCTAGPVPDVMAFRETGSWAYTHVVMAPYNSATNYQNNMYRKWQPFSGPSWTQNYGPGPFSSPQTGHDGLWLGYVQGAETIDGQRWWVVKDPGNPSINDYYASRWNQSTYFYYYYDDMYFGTGSQTDDDNGWHEAKDITADSSGRLYVLDELSSGQGRVKVFDEGNPGDALTDHAAGDSDNISEAPLRIEGSTYESSTYGNMIFVLHGDAVPCKLSVFFMSDFDF